jgi:hypothetical protein
LTDSRALQATAAREAGIDVVATQDLPRCRASLLQRRKQILDEDRFDRYAEGLCLRFYADGGGVNPGLLPRGLILSAPTRGKACEEFLRVPPRPRVSV